MTAPINTGPINTGPINTGPINTGPINTGPINIAFPFQVDQRGRIGVTDYADHIRDMIEQLLFTSPGERVLQPDLGCGLADLVFTPNSPELAAAIQASTQGALQRWLGDVITVVSLAVTADDATLGVTVNYQVLATGQQATATITGQVA